MPSDTTPPSSDDRPVPSRHALSKAPSWVMVGFVLGLLVFYTVNDWLNRPKPSAQPDATATTTVAQTAKSATETNTSTEADLAVRATTSSTAATPAANNPQSAIRNPQSPGTFNFQVLDYIFRKWAVNAHWEYDTAEVLFYNPADGKFSIAVEVVRRGAEGDYTYFYRPIDALTRPRVPDQRPDAVIIFTENQEATRAREEQFRGMWRMR